MGVMAGTPRTTAGRALALGGVTVVCGVLAVALGTRVAALVAVAGTARADELVPLGEDAVLANLVGDAAELQDARDEIGRGASLERTRRSVAGPATRRHDARRRRMSSRRRRSPSPSRLTKRRPEPPDGA